MNFKDLILKNRSYRRFYQDESVSTELLIELVDCARLSPSARNDQPLKYIISNDESKNSEIFDSLKWAGYLEGWDGPIDGERPAAYIIMLLDKDISEGIDCDHGIAAQSILLGATESGYGGCIIGAIDRPKLTETLKIDTKYLIKLVIAIGKPKEEVVIENIENDCVKYWRDSGSVHHVPKRELKDIILNID